MDRRGDGSFQHQRGGSHRERNRRGMDQVEEPYDDQGYGDNNPEQRRDQRAGFARGNDRRDGRNDFRHDRRRSRSPQDYHRERDGSRRNDSHFQGRNTFHGGNGRGRDRRRDRDQARYEDARRRGMVSGANATDEELAQLPSYINPQNVNIGKVIEQQEKRKLLWQGTKTKKETVAPDDDKNAAMWNSVTFSGDSDGAVANKFKKLMGLRAEASSSKQPEDEVGEPSSTASGSQTGSLQQNQEELFRNLDKQYQMARLSAHTQRGVGLGFGSR